MIKKIKYWWFRRVHGLPHPNEIKELVSMVDPNRAKGRFKLIATVYSYGMSIDNIALSMDVSRERIRQVLFRIVFEAKSKNETK